MKSRYNNEHEADQNYDFDDAAAPSDDEFLDDPNSDSPRAMNFYVEHETADSDLIIDDMSLDLYNLDEYGEELSPEEDDFDDDFDQDFIVLSDKDIHEQKYPCEHDPNGDQPIDVEQTAEQEEEFDSLNADENIYEGDE